MKLEKVLVVLFCTIILTALAVAAGAASLTERQDTIQALPPEVNTDGLCWPAQFEEKSVYVIYYTPEDAELIAKTVWGEARGCTPEGQAQVVWCILNRVDADEFPDTIKGVVTQPLQFHGYSPSYPVTPEILAVVNDVLDRWNLEKNGLVVTRELPSEFLYFTGDKAQRENHFRTEC